MSSFDLCISDMAIKLTVDIYFKDVWKSSSTDVCSVHVNSNPSLLPSQAFFCTCEYVQSH